MWLFVISAIENEAGNETGRPVIVNSWLWPHDGSLNKKCGGHIEDDALEMIEIPSGNTNKSICWWIGCMGWGEERNQVRLLSLEFT